MMTLCVVQTITAHLKMLKQRVFNLFHYDIHALTASAQCTLVV